MRSVPARLIAVLGLFIASEISPCCVAQQDEESQAIKQELRFVPPRSPEEARRTFRIADGFRIELVAAEPGSRSAKW